VTRPGVAAPATVTVVPNAATSLGLSRSLRLGLQAVPASVGAAVVLLVDQPTVGADLVTRLRGARGRTPVVATRAGGILGPPVLIEREAFPLADALRGDIGLRELLRSRPELVTTVDVEAPIPDVDTPTDLARITEPCPGCGARYLPQVADDAHPYLGASPACWAAFGELLAREFGNVAYGRLHRHTVDVYAVQHPGIGGRRQRQSVALHLIALRGWIEEGRQAEALNAETQRLASTERSWPLLDPPAAYPMTVVDVLEASDGGEHLRLVRRWAEATWAAWAAHHDTVRRWAAEG
jgi:hypothetical protein